MIALLLQVALFILVIEAALWCLPRAWRRASQTNCLRPNGSRSPNRTRLERAAYHRLRLELAAPLLLIFLSGNALYQTVDKSLVPMSKVASNLSESVGFMAAPNSTAEPVSIGVMIRVAVLSLLWLAFSLLIGGWTLVFACRSFVSGVRERSSEYSQFDVTRSAAATTVPKKSKSDHTQGSDVA